MGRPGNNLSGKCKALRALADAETAPIEALQNALREVEWKDSGPGNMMSLASRAHGAKLAQGAAQLWSRRLEEAKPLCSQAGGQAAHPS